MCLNFYYFHLLLCSVQPKKYWHSIIWISDPSLISETDESVASFKINVFMISGEDFPEVHRGDVIRFTNVKVNDFSLTLFLLRRAKN